MEPVSNEGRPRLSWRQVVLGGGAFLAGATLAYLYLSQYMPELAQKLRILGAFYLGAENNVSVWWSGATLFTSALLAYELSFVENRERLAWLGLASVCFALACDEIGSLHERWHSWSNYAVVGSFVFVVLAFVFRGLYRDAQYRSCLPGLLLGFGSFGVVAGLEWLEHRFVWPPWLEPLRLTLEEGIELFGGFLILQALVLQRAVGRTGRRFRALVPRPALMGFLMPLIAGGLLLHLVLAPLALRSFHDQRGHIEAIFPNFVYFALFAAAFWRHVESTDARRRAWQALALLFVVCSVGEMYNVGWLVPRLTVIVPLSVLSNTYFSIALQAALVLLIWRGRRDMLADRPKLPHLLGILVLVAVLALAGYDPSLAIRGIFPYLLAVFLL